MKKRFLSAALALAMVLTLIPATIVPAFAVTITTSTTNASAGTNGFTSGTSRVQYFGLGQLNYEYNMTQADWYYLDNVTDPTNTHTYYPVNTGVVGSNGIWYTDAATAVGNGQYSFTLMADDSSLSGAATAIGSSTNVTLQVDLNGNDLTLAAGISGNVTGLTLTDAHLYDRDPTGASKGTLANGVTRTGQTTGFTLNATNVNIGAGISLTSQRNSVMLNNSEVTGGITLNGQTTTASGATSTTTYVGQSLQTSNNSKITGNISITGDNNTITMSNTTQDNVATATFNVYASGGSIQISDNCTLGKITVAPHANQAVNTTLPSVSVTGSTVQGLIRSADPNGTVTSGGNSQLNTFTVSGNSKVPGGISTKYGNVTVTSSSVTGVTVNAGSLSLNGATVKGGVALGATTPTTVGLTVTGTNNTIGDTIANTANTLNLTVPADPDNGNVWGVISDSTGKGINKITGGTFLGQVPATWLVTTGNDARVFELLVSGKYTYRSQAQLGDILTAENLAAANQLVYIPHRGTSYTQSIEFYNGTTLLGTVKGNGYVPITLPAKIADQSTPTWYYGKVTYNAGANFTSGTDGTVKLETQVANSEVTKLTEVSATSANVRDNVRAALTQSGSGGTITLSGGVNSNGSTAITLDLTTDMILQTTTGTGTSATTTANPVVLQNVGVVYESSNGAVTFAANQDFTQYGITFRASQTGLTILHLSNGNEYTLTNGGINVIRSSLKIAGVDTETTDTGKAVIATVNISGLGTNGQAALKTKIETGASFDWSQSPAMRFAINAAASKITQTQIDQWVTAAQRAAWGTKYQATNNTTQLASTGYSEVWLVPYLAMNVTQQSDSGTMTATLVPSFRVEVRQPAGGTYTAWNNVFTNLNRTNPNQYPFVDRYVAQQGQTLGAITGTFGGVALKLGAAMDSIYGSYKSLHQDNTYVYPGAASEAKWTILNAGNTGLGSIVINSVNATVEMKRAAGANGNGNTVSAVTYYYDNLQAAVDQTLKQASATSYDEITLKQAYKESNPVINVTGEAREFKVKTEGNHSLSAANNNFTVTPQGTGKDWIVQLAKDTAASGQNITVSSVTGGSASVNANPATAGQTVTITLSASSGYVPSGVTVRDASNKAVTVSGSGSTYTFTMPSGSVTVTPSFTRTSTKATVAVSPNSMGNTTTTAAATNNQVDAGSSVGVTTYPSSGYRTMGVTIATNVGSVSANRVSDNYFTFTVPANATSVTVTPSYDLDNGTRFTDVWSSTYYSTPVAWAVNLGITTGQSSYLFGSNNTCTREQMVTFLYRAAGSPAVGNVRNPFWDVSPSAYYYNAVLWAVSKGITNGVSGNQFGVGQAVTRAQVVTFLYRYAGSPAASSNNSFYDVSSSAYYAKAVTWAVNKGVTNGTGSYTFSPTDNCLRRDVVTFLYRDLTNTRA